MVNIFVIWLIGYMSLCLLGYLFIPLPLSQVHCLGDECFFFKKLWLALEFFFFALFYSSKLCAHYIGFMIKQEILVIPREEYLFFPRKCRRDAFHFINMTMGKKNLILDT